MTQAHFLVHLHKENWGSNPELSLTSYCTASLHKLAVGRKLAATHLNVSNRQMCGCTGFKSGSYNQSYYNRPFKNDTGL